MNFISINLFIIRNFHFFLSFLFNSFSRNSERVFRLIDKINGQFCMIIASISTTTPTEKNMHTKHNYETMLNEFSHTKGIEFIPLSFQKKNHFHLWMDLKIALKRNHNFEEKRKLSLSNCFVFCSLKPSLSFLLIESNHLILFNWHE